MKINKTELSYSGDMIIKPYPQTSCDTARLIRAYGGDASIARAALLSRDSPEQNPVKLEPFIKSLMRRRHMTPFEFASVVYLFHVPIYVARQLMRYRSGAYVEKSLRFTKPEVSDVNALKEYHVAIKHGSRKENAREVLPLGTYTRYVMTIDVRNLLHLFDERLAKDTQEETRQIAIQMVDQFAMKFPVTHDAWTKYR